MTTLDNRLYPSASPYLQLYQQQPVAWQLWNDDTLALARQLDKPILLSIGYAACHWCQRMARESFCNPATAAIMNQRFINITVDREERPDLDLVYQTAHQLLTGRSGGWPLTVFLCPRTQLPFLVGTYFPAQSDNGQMSFSELLEKVDGYYRSRGKDFSQTLDQVKESYRQLVAAENTLASEVELSPIPIRKAAGDLLKSADKQWGGFDEAPKFPMPTLLERLLVTPVLDQRHAQPALAHLQKTLTVMARSGIHDQVGGGFFRYATNQQWSIPRFEKMLGDNGLLLALYAQSWLRFQDATMAKTARAIADWALRGMQGEHGGFFGSLAADSESQEGGYYLWDSTDIDLLLPPKQRAVVYAAFDLDKYPNFGKHWHLHRSRDSQSLAAELELDVATFEALLDSALQRLRDFRAQRPLPQRDPKVLTAWNGLMIRGLAIAARIFNDNHYLQAAQRAADFLREQLWVNKRLYGAWYDNRPQITGYLHDYVYLLDGLLELLRTQWRDEDYRFVAALAESLLENFEDRERGGFFFTAHDQPSLVFRSKPFFDTVMPAANGVAAKVLGRVGHLFAEPRYVKAAEHTLGSGWGSMLRDPKAHHSSLVALGEYLVPPAQILLKGDHQMRQWQETIQQEFGEAAHCYWVPAHSEFHPPEVLMLDDNQGLVCVGDHCLEPQDSLEGLMQQLQSPPSE